MCASESQIDKTGQRSCDGLIFLFFTFLLKIHFFHFLCVPVRKLCLIRLFMFSFSINELTHFPNPTNFWCFDFFSSLFFRHISTSPMDLHNRAKHGWLEICDKTENPAGFLSKWANTTYLAKLNQTEHKGTENPAIKCPVWVWQNTQKNILLRSQVLKNVHLGPQVQQQANDNGLSFSLSVKTHYTAKENLPATLATSAVLTFWVFGLTLKVTAGPTTL